MTSLKLNFTITYLRWDGEVGVVIGNIRYTYYLDAGFIPAILKLYKYKKGKALNLLKQVSYENEKKTR